MQLMHTKKSMGHPLDFCQKHPIITNTRKAEERNEDRQGSLNETQPIPRSDSQRQQLYEKVYRIN